MYDRKAQIGETVTWMVATIVIVLVLAISILATTFIINPDKKITFSEDKQKDLVASKSITSFLENDKNVELLKNKDYDTFEQQVKSLLEELPKPSVGGVGDWNFELYDGDEKKIEIYNYRLVTNAGQYNNFDTSFLLGQTKLRFWLECQGICK